MNNFAKELTIDEALEVEKASKAPEARNLTREQLTEMAKDDSMCDVCGNEQVWRYVGLGMCFTCTTGEADASEDYEIALLPS